MSVLAGTMPISVSAPDSGYVGVAISATISWDTGTGPFIGQVAWGDGSPPDQIDYQYTKSVVTKTHTYTAIGTGTYTITAIISDEGTGAWGSGTASIVINALPVLVTLDPLPNSVIVGDTVVFSGRVLIYGKPGPAGIGYVTPWISTHFRYLKHADGSLVDAYTDNSGYYSVSWVAWDQDGVLLGTHAFKVLENNAVVWSNSWSMTITAPTLSATLSASPTSGPVPLAVTFTIGASGGVTPYTGTLDYGDGVTGTVPVPGTWDHMYQKVGIFTATLTVTDALGANLVYRSKLAVRVGGLNLGGLILIGLGLYFGYELFFKKKR